MKANYKIGGLCCSMFLFALSVVFTLSIVSPQAAMARMVAMEIAASCNDDDPSGLNVTPLTVPGNPGVGAYCTPDAFRINFGSGAGELPAVSGWFDIPGGQIFLDFYNSPCGPAFDWVAGPGIVMEVMVVKGGPNANVYDYVANGLAPTEDTYLHSPLAGGGTYAGVSHIDFCYDFLPPEPTPIFCFVEVTNDVTCFGGDDGELVVTIDGGTEPFSLKLNGVLLADNLTEADFPYTVGGLMAGFYEVEITDSFEDDNQIAICFDDIDEPGFNPPVLACEDGSSGPCPENLLADFNAWKASLGGYTGGTEPVVISFEVDGQVVDLADVLPPDYCGGSVTVVTKAIDACGVEREVSCTFTVEDADELFVFAPGNDDLDACDFENQAALNEYFADWLAGFYFDGGCDPQESGLEGHVAPDLCEGGTVTVNYSVDDLCDSESLTRTFTLTPISPVAWDQMELPETYLELECDEEIPDMAILTASNSCGPVQVLMASSIALGECPNEYEINRSWRAVGVCGDDDVITYAQKIVVKDTKGPELVGDWVTYLPFLCGETVVVPRPEFEDNCTEMVETVCEVVGYPGADCYAFEFPEGAEVQLKFYAEDECGNASLDYYVTIYLEPCEVECETAYALGSNATCFIDEGFGNWGWTNYIEGPGTYVWPLWAAAGQCNTDNGVLAGSVSVEYDVYGFVNVTFNLFPGFTLEEEHVYAGYSMFPLRRNGRPTIAPGQYTNNGPFSGGIYVIAHAVVCGHFAAEVASLSESESFTAKDAGVNMIVTPNPFRDHAKITISAETDMQIAVEIYNLQGARVAVLYEGMIFENDTRIINYEAERQFDGTQIFMVVVRSQYGISTRKVLQTR